MRSIRLLLVFVLLLTAGSGRCQEPPARPAGPPDWAVTAQNLAAEVDEARRKYAAAPADARDSNLALSALEIDKLQLRLTAAWRDADWQRHQEESEKAVEEALKRLAEGRPAHQGETGDGPDGYFTRAYLCRTDGSPQPYYVRLPADYDPARPCPLVVFLHGYVPETSKIEPWVLPAGQWKLAADRGLILVMPHGRRNTDFLGIGEVDTLRVIEEMRRYYAIDPERIFMTGCSMGGYGGWAIGLRQPDLFAGLGLMAGQSDFFTWERRPRDEVQYKSWCILQNNPLDLAVNARHLPLLVQHGALDPLVPVVHSRLIVPAMQQFGYPIEYHEIADQGHYIYWDDPPFERLFDWCRPLRRVAAPKHVTFKTFTPKQGRCFWLDVRRLTRWGPPAEVRGEVADEKVTVTAANVAELWLDLPVALCPGELALAVNGHDAGRVKARPYRVRIAADGCPAPAEAADPPATRPRTGPAREVFNGPFLMTYATGDPATRDANQARAERLRDIWWAFAEGHATLAADRELTAEQVRRHNLVVCGEPGSVALAGIADPKACLPDGVAMAPGRYQVGRRTFTGDKLGMFLLTPHPLDDQRLILWCSGLPYGDGLPVNHRFDLLPDLLVYDDRIDWDGTNRFLIGGFLGQDWRLDESTLDVAPERAGE